MSKDFYRGRPNFTLSVVEGANGLPSADPLGCQIIFLLRLQGISRVEVNKICYQVNANVPKLVKHKGSTFVNPHTIRRQIDMLVTENIDHKFEALNISRIQAYKEQVTNVIEPVDLISRWGSEENMTYTVKLYARSVWFPYKFAFARSLRLKMKAEIEDLVGEDNETVVFEHIYKKASDILHDFSNALGTKLYMFGDNITTFDVYLISYLAPHVLLNYPNKRFGNMISSYENLDRYVRRFVRLYGDSKEVEDIQIIENDRAPTALIFAAGFFAVATMMGYAFMNGIIGRN